jgi:flagellar hook-length control protein FliK
VQTTDIKSTAIGIAHPLVEKEEEEPEKKKAEEPKSTKKKSKKTDKTPVKQTESQAKGKSKASSVAKASIRVGGDLIPMPRAIETELMLLEGEATKADFTEKKHFPQQLKPLYHAAVVAAMDRNALDANFFQHITKILPYNTFTMKKLASRLVYPDRLQAIKEALPSMYQDFGKQVEALVGDSSVEPVETPSQKKIKFTEKVRILFWNILCMEWEMAQMDNDIKTLNKETPAYQESGVRRAVYQKVYGVYVDGEQLPCRSIGNFVFVDPIFSIQKETGKGGGS